MEFIKPKIELYKTRSFSEKLTDTFDFLRETWKPMLKYFIYLMLPCSIVLGFFMNHFYSGYMNFILAAERIGGIADNAELVKMLIFMGLTFVIYLIVYSLLLALVFAIVRLYRQRDDRLKLLTADELKPELMYYFRRVCVLMLVSMGIGIVAVLVIGGLIVLMSMLHIAVGIITALLLGICLIAITLPLMLVTPIYMIEDNITVIGAFQKAFHLGFPTWGGIFAVSFVIGIIASVIETVTMGPWYVLYIIKMVFTLSNDLDGSFVNSFLYTFAEYITCVLQCLGMLIASVISVVGLTIQYGHAADKIDGVGVAQKIEKFDELDKF